jgi:hypothetical protein
MSAGPEPTATASSPAPPGGAADRRRAWLDKPADRALVALVVLVLAALPAVLMADELSYLSIRGDDFAYLSESRDGHRTVENLLTPHNAHVVPFFRLWTFALVRAAGKLSNVPTALLLGAYATFVVSLLLMLPLVARATGSLGAGLVAVTVLAASTVMEPVLSWFSASQALCAGDAALAALIALQSWREQGRGGAWKLGLAALGVVLAAGIWTGGLIAGPAAAAFLWWNRRRDGRAAAVAFLVLTAVLAVVPIVALRQQNLSPLTRGSHPFAPAAMAWQGVLSTSLAIPEMLVLRAAGVDARLEGLQGAMLCLAIAWLWYRSRRGCPGALGGLEAAGAVIAVGSYLMVYSFRGDLAYANLRQIGWYHAIPTLGAVLFAAGWWSRCRVTEGRGARPSRRGLASIVVLAIGMMLLHAPRAMWLLIEKAPPLSKEEQGRFPVAWLLRLRAVGLMEQEMLRQRRMLVRLETAENVARDLGVGRERIRRVFGRVIVPGIPEAVEELDAACVLALPDRDTRRVDDATVRQKLSRYLVEEPEGERPWLQGDGGEGESGSPRDRAQ